MKSLSPEMSALLAPFAALISDAVVERLRVQAPANGSPWIDAKASCLGVRGFRAAARAGEFPIFKIGRRYVARCADVDAFIERRRVDFAAKKKTAALDPFERALVRRSGT